ncbi:unnamed protein product [Moneuplotes crassus]|uniref:Protein kinase domain-containing protein n=1 Tax=Euplotes crassus TaxID=5936 RepID=A0AAD2CXK6_EUPCR|nr:unnamed protein product [Moneuplotes crassus]
MESISAPKKPIKPKIPRHMHSFTVDYQEFIVDKRYEFLKLKRLGFYCTITANDTIRNRNVDIEKLCGYELDKAGLLLVLYKIRLHTFFEHENILKILDIPKPIERKDFKDFYIVSQSMETNLARVIASRQHLSEEHLQYFIFQIVRGLHYIHSAGISHGNLSPQNISLNRNCDLKISELGHIDLSDLGIISTECIPSYWHNPLEKMLGIKTDSRSKDIWSLGCILGEMVKRSILFDSMDHLDHISLIIKYLGYPSDDYLSMIENKKTLKYMKKLKKTRKGDFNALVPDASPSAIDFMLKCLKITPSERATTGDLLKHPFLEEFKEEENPECTDQFPWDWRDFKNMSINRLKRELYSESLKYHPK